MGALDVHAHAFPDDIASRAIERLEADCPWKAVAGGTVRELLESMDAADIDITVICAVATRPDQPRGILRWCKRVRSERIEPFPSVHPQTRKPDKWIARIADAGFAGIKLHPMYQDFRADDERMDAIYSGAAEHGLVVAMHCGRDIAFPEDDRASPGRIRRVIDRHPTLKLLATHMGGWRMWDEVERELLGRNVHMETSFSIEMLGPQRAADIIRRHGVERVCVGSDWPWRRQDEALKQVQALPLPEADICKVVCSNAARLLGY